jgi:hypothetical protein
MRRTVLLTLVSLVLVTATAAQAVTFYLHRSGVPVPVPGGTTTFVLDENPPVAPIPVAESISVPKKTAGALPTFIAPPFPSPATLGLDFDVVVELSANQSMNSCAAVTVVIERVDTTGGRSLLARGAVTATLPPGTNGGTAGFAPVTLAFVPSCQGPFADATINTGESIAVTLSVTNGCKANRTVFLAYDATSAPSAGTFAPLTPDPDLLAKCVAKCEVTTSKASVKFIDAKSKCVLKCEGTARKGASFLDCDPPYAGVTATCIEDPEKGAEAKARAAIVKACAFPKACPPCYSGGDCTVHAPVFVLGLETRMDALLPAVFCEQSAAHAKCMDGNAKALSKFAAAKTKCYDKCVAAVNKGRAVPGSCVPPATDPDTSDCIATAEGKAVATVNKVCFLSSTAPACYDNGVHPPAILPSPSTALAWMGLVEVTIVDSTVPEVYCTSSPSGAFID